MAKLINGDGNPAIYAAEDSDWFASIMGNQTSITGVGSQFAATITDANTVTVADGVIITKEGRRIQLDVNMDDSFTIPAGQQDVTNYYIIGYHLVSDDLSVQTAEKFVQLMDSASATIPEDTFRGGADDVYVSLYRVTQVGLSLTSLQALLPKITNVHGTEAMLATVQNSNKASRTFNKGEYIQLNNTYYKITATVASGATFTEGVNISATNIGDELTQINSDLTESNLPNISEFTRLTYGGQLNTGSSYVNTDLFVVPSTAKEIYVAFTNNGSVGGIQKFVKGINVLCLDYQLDRCIFTWNPTTNKIKCSYAYMTAGAGVTWYCYYR